MMKMSELASAVKGTRIGADAGINAVVSDSRSVSGGELFVALRGERFDGHQFVLEAVRKGAAGVLVDNRLEEELPQVVVENTELSLGKLAANWRRRFNFPVVAVTGSNGKTTVKEMVGSILRHTGPGMVSHGNFNNTIGLPLSLLRLRAEHEFATVEIGMNQVGEIEYLAKIALPTTVIITNANSAHLQNLKSVEKVATEKGMIISGLGNNGTAVLNADDQYIELWRKQAQQNSILTFGTDKSADVVIEAKLDKFSSEVLLSTFAGEVQFKLNLAGLHNVKNAAAAAAAGLASGASLEQVKAGLESVNHVEGRLRLRQHFAGGDLIDDTYNANPASLKAALDVLASVGGDRRLVMGDMLELGDNAEEFHREAGSQARQAGIGRIYAIGKLSEATAKEFGRGAKHYMSHEEIVSDLVAEVDSGTTILVKGSRGMKMEQVVHKLIGESSC